MSGEFRLSVDGPAPCVRDTARPNTPFFGNGGDIALQEVAHQLDNMRRAPRILWNRSGTAGSSAGGTIGFDKLTGGGGSANMNGDERPQIEESIKDRLESQRQRLEVVTAELNSLVAGVASNIIAATSASVSPTAVALMTSGPSTASPGPGFFPTTPIGLHGGPMHGQMLPLESVKASEEVHDLKDTFKEQEPEDGFDAQRIGSLVVNRPTAAHADDMSDMPRNVSTTRWDWGGTGITQDLLPPERQKLVLRLQARLGFRDGEGIVFATRVHRSLDALGSEKYHVQEIEEMLVAIGQAFPDGFVSSTFEFPATANSSIATSISKLSADSTAPSMRLTRNRLTRQNMRHFDRGSVGIRFRSFIKALLDNDIGLRYSPEMAAMILTVREVLISGDANRLVAKLTQVHVDDLAAPEQKVDFINRMEPIVALVILVNGIMIGIQTDVVGSSENNASIWFWADLPFSIFFLLEMLVKLWRSGVMEHFWSHEDWAWNWFDALVVFFAGLDIFATIISISVGANSLTVVRIVRLTKLSRLIRMFHLRHMRELSLMVKGLVAGMRTLFWAIVLLFFTVYIIAVVATQSLGLDPKLGEKAERVKEEELFATVPRSMLTVFRCFVGDCEDSRGSPIVHALTEGYGWKFSIPYVAATVFVTFGLFNLIFAIYIETTLSAAKLNRKMSRQENLRVARLTKELLKKFCHAHNVSAELAKEDGNATGINGIKRLIRGASMIGELEDFNMTVSKDLFLYVIADHEVQALMDMLDIPPDREHLFDIIDADGSGDLQASELIRGLLWVRGEARKSDVVAALLAVRAVQSMVREVGEMQHEMGARLANCQRSSSFAIDDRMGFKKVGTASSYRRAPTQYRLIEGTSLSTDKMDSVMSQGRSLRQRSEATVQDSPWQRLAASGSNETLPTVMTRDVGSTEGGPHDRPASTRGDEKNFLSSSTDSRLDLQKPTDQTATQGLKHKGVVRETL